MGVTAHMSVPTKSGFVAALKMTAEGDQVMVEELNRKAFVYQFHLIKLMNVQQMMRSPLNRLAPSFEGDLLYRVMAVLFEELKGNKRSDFARWAAILTNRPQIVATIQKQITDGQFEQDKVPGLQEYFGTLEKVPVTV